MTVFVLLILLVFLFGYTVFKDLYTEENIRYPKIKALLTWLLYLICCIVGAVMIIFLYFSA
jgi:hypothetical protein